MSWGIGCARHGLFGVYSEVRMVMIEDDNDNGSSDDGDGPSKAKQSKPSKAYKEVTSGCVMIGKTFHCSSLAKMIFFNISQLSSLSSSKVPQLNENRLHHQSAS